MKKSGEINAKLAGALAELGHTDRVVVCAAGLPLPPGPEVVDLAFRFGVPSSEVVLSGLLEELVVEGATAAEEVERNPRPHELLTANLPDLGLVPHEELKRMVAAAKLVVRTGEATPYSNVILRCGVPFLSASLGSRLRGSLARGSYAVESSPRAMRTHLREDTAFLLPVR